MSQTKEKRPKSQFHSKIPNFVPVPPLPSSGASMKPHKAIKARLITSSKIPKPNELNTAKEVQEKLEKVTEASELTVKANLYRVEVAKKLEKSVLEKSSEKVIENNQRHLEIAENMVEVAEEEKSQVLKNAQEKLTEILQNPNKHSNKIMSLAENTLQVIKKTDRVATPSKKLTF